MRIAVDSSKCQGHNLCLSYIPHLLDVDELGYVTPIEHEELSEQDLAAARIAVGNCPEEALTSIDDRGAPA